MDLKFRKISLAKFFGLAIFLAKISQEFQILCQISQKSRKNIAQNYSEILQNHAVLHQFTGFYWKVPLAPDISAHWRHKLVDYRQIFSKESQKNLRMFFKNLELWNSYRNSFSKPPEKSRKNRAKISQKKSCVYLAPTLLEIWHQA